MSYNPQTDNTNIVLQSNKVVANQAPPLPKNFMQIIFAALVKDQITIADLQAVGSKTGLTLSDLMTVISNALNPTPLNGQPTTMSAIFTQLNSIVGGMKPGDSKEDTARKSAQASLWQNILQSHMTQISNHQSQGNTSLDQVNNRVQQDGTDLSQKMQVLSSVFGITATNAQLVAR